MQTKASIKQGQWSTTQGKNMMDSIKSPQYTKTDHKYLSALTDNS